MPMTDDEARKQWNAFSPDVRSQKLAKMTPVQKNRLSRILLSDNPNKEGVYQMKATPGEDFVSIPYSRVMDASGLGYRIRPQDRETYARDRSTEVLKQQPKLAEIGRTTAGGLSTNSEYLKAMQLPEAVPEKPGLWSRVESKVEDWTEPTTVFHDIGGTPANMEMQANLIKRIGRVLFGVPDMGPQVYSAVKDALSSDPQKAKEGEQRFIQLVRPDAQAKARFKELKSDWQRDPRLAAANVGGDIVGMWLAGKAMEVPMKGAQALEHATGNYRPIEVPIDGEVVPVTVGEYAPTTLAGRYQLRLKRAGMGAKKFEELESEQLRKVKAVMRNTAQETSELIGPMKNEPGAAMGDAAETTLEKARPMYRALDQALRTMPASFGDVSPILKDAISRARKLGAQIEPDAELYIDGGKVTPQSHPVLWQRLLEQGIIDETGGGTPLTALQKIRSLLYRMQRSSPDASTRYAIGNEIRNMNANIEAALKNSPKLLDSWKEADRLWSKGYALRTVAETITNATKGTPIEAQASWLDPVPQRMQATSLVSALNDLAADGTLDKAFTAEQRKNLRASADVLDRIQRTKVGTGPGSGHMSEGRALSAALHGSTGPAFGALVGGTFGGWHGLGFGALLGAMVQQFSERAVVDVMTTPGGVKALVALERAMTPTQRALAVQKLTAAVAAQSAARQPAKSPKQLQAEAAKLKPAGATSSLAAAPAQ